jgi:cytochrome c peroxidase
VNNDYSRYTCYGCHEHTPANVRSEHEEEGIRNFDNCVKCHRNATDEPKEGGGEGGGRDRRERD